jgi:hypothetical protein
MIIQTVDRSITEHLRRKTVELGFLPDVTLYSSSVDYAAAKEALKITNNLKSIIEVYGIGASETRDDKSDAKIFLDRAGEQMGTVGGWPEEFYTKNIDGTWNKYKMPDMTYDVMYELRTITTNTQIDRTMDSIIRRVLGARKYIKLIDVNGIDTNIVILVLFKGSADVSGDGYLERVYKYEVNQVWLEEPELLAENIPALISYDANIIPTELIVVPEPPPPPPTCNVNLSGIWLSLNVVELTVGVSLSAIVGLSRLVLSIRSALTAYNPIQEIVIPIDNVLTDFQFLVDMNAYPTEVYFFQVQAFTTCDDVTPSSVVETFDPFFWYEVPKTFDVTEFAFAPDGGGNLAIQMTVVDESRVVEYQVLYRQDQNPMTPFYPVATVPYDANAGGVYNLQLIGDFNTNNILYFVVLGRFDDVTSQQDDQGNNSPEAVTPNPTYFQFDNRKPETQLLIPVSNVPQKQSIEEWTLVTAPVAGCTYQLEFIDAGASKFVDPNGTQSTQLFIDGSNWYNPRIMWPYSTLDTQTISPYIRMSIYNSVGSTVCADVSPDFNHIVVIALNVWLRGAINTASTLNTSGILQSVYGFGTPEYFVTDGVNTGNPNPYGNIKMEKGFYTFDDRFLVDVVKVELREEDINNPGFPSETVVDSTFMWCRRPSKYTSGFGLRRCVDFLTAKQQFVALSGDPLIEYFVVVKHRNHLTVSSRKQLLSAMGNSTFINIATGFNAELVTGGTEFYYDTPNFVRFMQYGNAHDELGDVGEVNATDLIKVTADENLQVGYSNTDANLDGHCDALDVAIVTEGEVALYYSGVPNPSLL